MKTLLAFLVCVGLLVILFGLFGIIEVGIYEKIVSGQDFNLNDLSLMNSPVRYRITAIAGMMAVIYAIFDLYSLTAKERTKASNEPQPRSQPIQFAMVRARRYFAIFFIMAYVAFFARVFQIHMSGNDSNRFTASSCVVFTALVLVARRPLPWANADVFAWVMFQISSFCKGFAGNR